MKIQIPLVYSATVVTASGGTDQRTYRETVEFEIPVANGAPVACQWKGAHIQQGVSSDVVKTVRIHGGEAFEAFMTSGRYDHAQGVFVYEPVRADEPGLGETFIQLVKENYTTRPLIEAQTVKRAGPPKPKTVVRSDRDEIIERIRDYVAEELRAIDGILHGRSSLPVIKVEVIPGENKQVSVQFNVVAAHSVNESEWLSAFPLTELEAATETAKEKVADLETRGFKAVFAQRQIPVDIIDANLVGHDMREVLHIELMRKAERLLANHLVKGSKLAADCYDDIRKSRWPNRQDNGVSYPETDLAVLMRAAEVYADENGEEAPLLTRVVERFRRVVAENDLAGLDL